MEGQTSGLWGFARPPASPGKTHFIQHGVFPFSLGLTISTGKSERYSTWGGVRPAGTLQPFLGPASPFICGPLPVPLRRSGILPWGPLLTPLAFRVLSPCSSVLQPTQTPEQGGEKPPRTEALLVSRFTCPWRHKRLIADTVSSKTT